ncbi:MAG: aldose 1-epimerase [Ruminococcus sp.]|nr:aldose 1-epimerase [Ruminococcus sp.]
MGCSVDTAFKCKGIDCVRLEAGRYFAVISPLTGSSVLRLFDTENDIEVFRYSEACTLAQYNKAREIWGLPTLYLPNRFDGGVLKTGDATYHLPVNETLFGNHIHGWAHKRAHKLELAEVQGDKAVCITTYTFGKDDEMYSCFPVDFRLTYKYELSEAEGLVQTLTLENLSDKRLPVSLCTHTCMNAPMTPGGKQTGLRLTVPIGEKCELNERCLPTEELLPLTYKDMRYKNGSMRPVLHQISNDMYTAVEGELDGKPFYGVTVTDKSTGKRVCNEVSKEYKFWNMWNDRGGNGYFCPEPMTAMINAANLGLKPEVSGHKELKKGESFECRQRFFTLA